jgi:hypothetical protein
MATDSQILTIPVPPETVAADDAKYADTPLRYEITLNEAIPGGCIVSGYYKSRVSDGEFKQDNIQCRRLVVMLLERAAKLERERDQYVRMIGGIVERARDRGEL